MCVSLLTYPQSFEAYLVLDSFLDVGHDSSGKKRPYNPTAMACHLFSYNRPLKKTKHLKGHAFTVIIFS